MTTIIPPPDPMALPRRVFVEFTQGSAVIRKPGMLERIEQPAPVAWVRMDDGPTKFVALERCVEWEGDGGPDPHAGPMPEPGDGFVMSGDGGAVVGYADPPLPPGVAKLARSMPVGGGE